jgi:hypothetical protein
MYIFIVSAIVLCYIIGASWSFVKEKEKKHIEKQPPDRPWNTADIADVCFEISIPFDDIPFEDLETDGMHDISDCSTTTKYGFWCRGRGIDISKVFMKYSWITECQRIPPVMTS